MLRGVEKVHSDVFLAQISSITNLDFFGQFGDSWGGFWDHFGVMFGHLDVLEAKISKSDRFSRFDPTHFGGF